ncbi:MAG: PucR family transcriptional regulator, partial [Mycobacterium sp.]
MTTPGVSLGQLVLALDATMVTLVEAPRGLDLPVASAALIDPDDVRLGLAAAAVSADVFLLLGVGDDDVLSWLVKQAPRTPAAIFVKEPSAAVITRAIAVGTAVAAVEPRARWERLYRLIDHVFEHHGDRADPLQDSGTDLFGLAQSIAERTHGMVSIEDVQSHVLAYSASNDEADELRRLSILGRAGPPEHLAWIGREGIFDALRASTEVVRVDARPELELQPRRAVGIHLPARGHNRPAFAGTIWVQE